MSSGILLLNKPTGISSARVLTPLKRLFPKHRIGHTGTLDPFADGLLVVLVGSATRLSRWFLTLDKRYRAVVALGEETDTLDVEGESSDRAPLVPFSALTAVRSRFVGTVEQVPPIYSALKIDGKRAYQRARDGELPTMKPREVVIHELTLTLPAGEPPEAPQAVELDMHCGSGTYVRAVARDLPRAAGTRGYCRTLRRTAVGPFSVDDGYTVEQLTELPDAQAALIPMASAVHALGVMPVVTVAEDVAGRMRHGAALHTLRDAAAWPHTGPALVVCTSRDATHPQAVAVVDAGSDDVAGRRRLTYQAVFPEAGSD